MIRPVFIICAALSAVSTPVFAQTVEREAVPAKKQVIIANSPADLALQEEIRRIEAYNAYVESQIGVSEVYTELDAPIVPLKPAVIPAKPSGNLNKNVNIELFAPTSSTRITYATENGQTVSIQPATIKQINVIGAKNAGKYRIAQGDTLYSLARKNCISVADIRAANGLEGNNIKIGQMLDIPASQCADAKTITAKTDISTNIKSETDTVRRVLPLPTTVKIDRGQKYAVLPKDTLYSIGKRYCLSADELAGYNGIDKTAPIKPGQILSLPKNSCIK